MPFGSQRLTERLYCEACGREIETSHSNQATPNTCHRWQCRGQRLAQAIQRQLDTRAKRQREQIKAAALTQAANEGCKHADRLQHVVIPATDAQRVPVSDGLRLSMIRHLETQAAQCNEQLPAARPRPKHPTAEPWQSLDEDISATEQEAWSNACATCRGQCCHYGAETMAFITPETLTRYATTVRSSAPHDKQIRPSLVEIVRDYAAHIPTDHIDNSCIFHTEIGCALPRDMRADICNQFVCNGLKELHEAYQQSPPGLLITAISNGSLRRQRVVDLSSSPQPAGRQSDTA